MRLGGSWRARLLAAAYELLDRLRARVLAALVKEFQRYPRRK